MAKERRSLSPPSRFNSGRGDTIEEGENGDKCSVSGRGGEETISERVSCDPPQMSVQVSVS
jgi:hypothetical protein